MYYYRRKTSPFKWIIIIALIIVIGGFGYWFYVNYFSKIEFPKAPLENKNLNQIIEEPTKIISANLTLSNGDVQVSLANKDYTKAIKDTVLVAGDKVKTGAVSNAIIKLENNSIIRLGENTEIVLLNLEANNIILEQNRGRTYHNLITQGTYQLKFNNALITALGTKFEAIINDKLNYLAVLDLEGNVKVEVLDNQDVLLSVRLEPNEKALLNLNAAKKDKLKIENFDPKILAKDAWYKWNFDLDSGLTTNLEEEPDFSVIKESLELAAELKEAGIYLSWSAYGQDDFKNYKIMRSEKNADLKYPDDEVIKSSAVKELNSYLDTKIEKGTKYFYRVCVLKTNDKVVCGNAASLEIAKEEEKDMIAPAAAMLSATTTVSGVNLSWTPNSEEDFAEYRVFKSLTNSNPILPQIGYLAIKNKGQENYLDKEVNITSAGIVYYRVCSLDKSGNSACSNVETIENGQVK